MMVQFHRAKKEAPDALLFFRMGDFYELFHDDAVVASRELGLTLTARSKGADAIPMAGVPVKAAEGYVVRLVRKGHKVAICEQLTDPRESKGIVDRGIVRIVTPGTLTEENVLDARENNFLASTWKDTHAAGLAWVDLSTGRLLAQEVALDRIEDELERVSPSEVLAPSGKLEEEGWLDDLSAGVGAPAITEREEWRYDRKSALRSLKRHFGVASLEGFGIEEQSAIVPAAGALIEYIQETQRATCEHIRRIERVETSDHVVLDRATRSCLELVATQRDGQREGSVLDAMDGTRTPMGARLLKSWLLTPLQRSDPILQRQRGVAELAASPGLRDRLSTTLDGIHDIERLVSKVSTGRANARDLVALGSSLSHAPHLIAALEGATSEVLAETAGRMDPLADLTAHIQDTLADEPPMAIKEGGIISDGVSSELDELRRTSGDGRSSMARFQAAESEATRIQGLKIGYNSVFGYFIEVPRGQVDRVPEHYVRKQTIKSAERYITPELKEFETRVLKSDELARDLEYEIFCKLRDEVAAATPRILDTADAIAWIDTLTGLAQIAAEHRYVAPSIHGEDSAQGGTISITDGRHPVIERSPECDSFVPNDSVLDGPNMSGKSTYIRQTAIITLLAQIGSFVPAGEASIGVVDRIFTRVGAGDDISHGASTFMVEMVEIANILNNATERSLVILDEVGRGTSTFDGLALAWAIAEFIHERIGCRTLFATHYHQLTDLSARYAGVCNKNVAVREWGDEIVFLHRIVEGGTDRSYGIHVARLAGVPSDVVERARTILADLERDEDDLAARVLASGEGVDGQRGLFETQRAAPTSTAESRRSPIEQELEQLDPDGLSPFDALLKIRAWRDSLKD